jgi:hypothetical protein
MPEPEAIDVVKFQKEEFQKKTMGLLNAMMGILSARTAKARVDPDPEAMPEEAVVQGVVCSALMVLSTMRFSEEEGTKLQQTGLELAEQLISAAEHQAVKAQITP